MAEKIQGGPGEDLSTLRFRYSVRTSHTSTPPQELSFLPTNLTLGFGLMEFKLQKKWSTHYQVGGALNSVSSLICLLQLFGSGFILDSE